MNLNKHKIHMLMATKGIGTQEKLAELIGISKSQLSFMLSSEYNPIRTRVDLLAKALNVSISELLVDGEQAMPHRLDFKVNRFTSVEDVVPLNTYTVFETFAGAGGLALGFEKAGFKTIGAVELDRDAADTLRFNRPKWNVIHDNIIDVANGELSGLENVTILSGGYPCQAFSYAGQRKGLADIRGTLFYPYSQLIEALKPKIFVAENVKGLVNHDGGKTLDAMIHVFRDKGYTVHWNVLNAWDYNVAQKRERIFIIGIRNDLIAKEKTPFAFPQANPRKPVLRDVLRSVPESPGISYSQAKKEVLDLVPPGGSWVHLPQDIAKRYLGASWHSGGGKRGMARRLSWDEPSLTLTTSPSQKQTERCHPDETRPFTTREYARIQSFPDDWAFSGSISSIYKQIGNAVPVNLAADVGKSIIKYLNQFEEK